MMEKNDDYYYAGITSLEDLRLERTRLILKGRLLESKISVGVDQLKDRLSLSSIAGTLVRGIFLPKISGLIGIILNMAGTKEES